MNCALCNAEARDEKSHIIPKFAIKWQKSVSPTGYLRATGDPRKRLQDGIKKPFLGPACEDLFSKWEGEFAKRVFHPIHSGGQPGLVFNYEEWFAKFCVSISWRALQYLTETGACAAPFPHTALVQAALSRWRDFLLGNNPHIDPNWQYFFVLDDVVRGGRSDEERREINLYINSAFDFNTMHNADECYIFTKFGKIMIVGSIHDSNPRQWRNCKIGLKGGNCGPGDFRVSGCFTRFFETAVEEIRAARAAMKPEDLERMEQAAKQKAAARPRPAAPAP